MKKKTKIISVSLLTAFMFLFTVSIVFAAAQPGAGDVEQSSIDSPGDLLDLFRAVANWIQAFILVVGIIFIIMAGYTWITAGGDETKITTARQQLIWGIVGIGVAILAFGAVQLVDTLLG